MLYIFFLIAFSFPVVVIPEMKSMFQCEKYFFCFFFFFCSASLQFLLVPISIPHLGSTQKTGSWLSAQSWVLALGFPAVLLPLLLLADGWPGLRWPRPLGCFSYLTVVQNTEPTKPFLIFFLF